MKPNIIGIFSKAATADVKAILANDANTRGTGATTARTLAVALGVGTPYIFVSHDERDEVGLRLDERTKAIISRRQRRRKEVGLRCKTLRGCSKTFNACAGETQRSTTVDKSH